MSEEAPRRTIWYEHSADMLVRFIVDAALSQESDKYGYTRKTILQDRTEEMIRSEVTDAFKAWLEEHRPVIRNAVLARLNLEKGDFFQKIADSQPAW